MSNHAFDAVQARLQRLEARVAHLEGAKPDLVPCPSCAGTGKVKRDRVEADPGVDPWCSCNEAYCPFYHPDRAQLDQGH